MADDAMAKIAEIRYQLTQLTVSLGANNFDQAGDAIRRIISGMRTLQSEINSLQTQQVTDEGSIAGLAARVSALETWARTVTPPFGG